jgi:hypothetical protein
VELVRLGKVTDFERIGLGNLKTRGSQILGFGGPWRRVVERRGVHWLVGLFGGRAQSSLVGRTLERASGYVFTIL